jgi:integrase/recombinase XerD
MKQKIVLRRISHRGQARIAVIFGYDDKLTALLRKSISMTWSNTNSCWYADDNEENLRKIISSLRNIADIDISGISSSVAKEEIKPPSEPGTLHRDFPTPPSFDRAITNESLKKYGPVEFTIDEADDKLIIKFIGRYDPEWIKEVKSFGKVWFDTAKYEWVLDWSRLTVDSLSDYFSQQGVEVLVKRNKVSTDIKDSRDEQGSEIRGRELDAETMEGIEDVRRYLNERRYSNKTVDSYISQIILFFKYFFPKKPSELTEDDISDFFHDYIVFNKYSASYQNQIISGLKIYFMLNGKGRFDSSSMGRPRRKRALPKVFSKDEVKSILNSTRNIKHRLLLWIIYSCGLRRSEVINIKMEDLDRGRGILNIMEAKGKVDRFVPVSGKVWEKIDEYIESYNPGYWLFEGQTGGKYSSESVYRVFKQALKSAGIKKEVGVHSLRHSYATHLHENGLDIRYIQELLGHKSTRTTEIYTHVSRRNLIAVRSPIEDMDLR